MTGVQVGDGEDDEAAFGIGKAPSFANHAPAVPVAPAPAQPPVTPPPAAASPAPPSQKQLVSLPAAVKRVGLSDGEEKGIGLLNDSNPLTIDAADSKFEDNLAKLLNHSINVALHDRKVANSLIKVHLERGEMLDGLPLSVAVASVISDNTGATLKALELSMKAGERIQKVAELLVTAKRNDDAAALAAAKIQKDAESGTGQWGDTSEIGRDA